MKAMTTAQKIHSEIAANRFERLIKVLVEKMPRVSNLGLDWKLNAAYPYENQPEAQPITACCYVETGNVKYDAYMTRRFSQIDSDAVIVSFDASALIWKGIEIMGRGKKAFVVQIGGGNGELWFDEEAPEALRILVSAKREKRDLTEPEKAWLRQNTARALDAKARGCK